ncbi:MAG TPA: prolipoprotein diacylglyceryl transferase family protein [Actinomycetota bacterium]
MLASVASIGWPVLDRIRFGDVFAISPHGVFIAIGFLIGAWLLGRISVRWGVPVDTINGVVFWSLIGAIIGSRLFYVIAHFSDFDNDVGEMLAIWRGGISLLGGIAGAVIINAVRVRGEGYRFFQVADPVAPALALGIAVGRIGDLIIADHLGRPTSWLLAWQYRGGTIAPPFQCVAERCSADLQGDHLEKITRAGAELRGTAGVIASGIGVHQTALYDMLLAGALFLFLWFVMMRRPRREGILTLTFGLWYGLSRLLEDSLRIDKRFFGLTGSQWTALAVASISAGLLIWWALRPDPDAPSGGGPKGSVPDPIATGARTDEVSDVADPPEVVEDTSEEPLSPEPSSG